MDHRRLQRALFRMQHDAGFAARLRAGDVEAAASTGLGTAELACLRGADPLALAADRGGRRADQLLRNLASELRLATALGPAGDGRRDWLADFPRAPVFHRAVSDATPLPLAFAAWAEARAGAATSTAFRALVALEAALVRARRTPAVDPSVPPAGTVVRAPTAALLELPAGTHAAAAALARALDAGAAPPLAAPAVDETRRETLLVAADPASDARFGRLRTLRVEPLVPLVAALLRRAERPLDRAARASFAERHDVELAAVEAVIAEYRAEGVLLGAG